MKKLLCSVCILICWALPAQAELVVTDIKASGNVESQSIAVLSGSDFVFYPAQLEKTQQGMSLSAEIAGLSADTLLAGVVVLADGRVVSSALRKVGETQLELGSSALLAEQIARLKNEIAVQRGTLEKLQEELELKSSQLRKQAGLEDVDAIYSRVKQLETEIQALKAQ